MEHWVINSKGEPVLEPDLMEWARWYATAERHIGDDTINGERVSTVFLGIDHNSARRLNPNMMPILWETMVFGGVNADFQQRYSTREEALAGHAEVVRRLREGLPLNQ